MTRLFLDTGVFVALVHKGDKKHDAARQLLDQIAEGHFSGVYTSDYVLAEAWNFIRMKIRKREAAEAVSRLAFGASNAPPLVTDVLRVHGHRFAAALARYRTEFQRGLSFTDWTNVVLMDEEQIVTIGTFDAGFTGLVTHVVP